MKKRLMALLIASGMALSLAGCGGSADSDDSSSGGIGAAVSNAASSVGTAVQAQGRDYGKTYDLTQEEAMETAFFRCNVNSAALKSVIDDYIPNSEDHQFLVVNVTVENTYTDDTQIPMFDSDFELTWDELEGDTIFPESEFAENQLPEEYEILKGESRTGDLIYVIPKTATNLRLKYQEYWDDDFEGNIYYISFAATAES